MKNDENKQLDQSLRELSESIKWDEKRQQHIKSKLIHKLSEQSSRHTQKKENRLKNFWLPIISSIMVILTMMVILISESPKPLINNSNSRTNDLFEEQTSIMITEEQYEKIRDIQDSGFSLAIPNYSPQSDTIIENITHRQNEDHTTVSTKFYSNTDELFSFYQEKINSKAPSNHIIENDYSERIVIQGIPTYYTNNGVQRQLFIITEKYSLEISSYELPKEELIKIIKSVNLEKIT